MSELGINMEKSIKVKLGNKYGLHLRAAAELVKLTSKFKSSLFLQKEGSDFKVNAKSIISVLTLGASCGEVLIVYANGEDAEEALLAIKELIEEKRFNEEQ